jgi:hypothetical protein
MYKINHVANNDMHIFFMKKAENIYKTEKLYTQY